MNRYFSLVAGTLFTLALAACGGGGGSGISTSSTGSSSSSSSSTGAVSASVPLSVDAGPLPNTSPTANILYATVTICPAGVTTGSSCQAVDHVQVDTQSSGLRIISSVLNNVASLPAINDPTSGSPLLECAQFADGYTWGSMVSANVIINGNVISNVPVNLIGALSTAAPTSCSQGATEENTVDAFGANGVLGISNYVQDCGNYCTSASNTTPPTGLYYVCPGSTCSASFASLADQTSNVLALSSAGYNGVVVSVGAVSEPGANSVAGTLYFGINTNNNNAVASGVKFLGLDSNLMLASTFNGTALTTSFIDSGSNTYSISDVNSGVTTCSLGSGANSALYYCPTATLSETASLSENAGAVFATGASATASFFIDNAPTDYASSYSVFPGLASVWNISTFNPNTTFDFGLPFFFGRPVYVLFENQSVTAAGNKVTGPALGF